MLWVSYGTRLTCAACSRNVLAACGGALCCCFYPEDIRFFCKDLCRPENWVPRAGKYFGASGTIINWHPFKSVLFKLLWPKICLKIFLRSCAQTAGNFRIIFFCVCVCGNLSLIAQ
jgi:hypothetical protein